MLNARRYECFCVDPQERLMYAGDISGQISVIDIDSFAIVNEVQAHSGVLRALAVHPTLPYVAGMGTDHCVTIWQRDDEGGLAPVCALSYRDIPCANDAGIIAPIVSHSIALGFHGSERRLVTRTGNGGVVELQFDEQGTVEVRWSLRAHGDWDVQMTRYVAGSDQVLSAGRDGCLVLIEDGRELRRWQLGDSVAHWAEQLDGSVYLIASDICRVARVDLASEAAPAWGERFAHDDMEYLTYNRHSGRAFATSFDRNVYEIDPVSCNAIGVAYQPGYKCIWAKTLERAPHILLVQSRDGSLHKADLATGKPLAVIQQCPPALWSVVSLPGGDLLAAGEGNRLTQLHFEGVCPLSRTPRYSADTLELEMGADSYTKRMVRQEASGLIALGRTDGEIWTGKNGAYRRLLNLHSAVRDLAVAPDRPELYAVTEDGRALKIDLRSGRIELSYQTQGNPFPLALWAMAYNPARKVLAVAEFGGKVTLLSASDFSIICKLECERVKRMRWADADLLLYGGSEGVFRYRYGEAAPSVLVTGMHNTVEDFIWDARRTYLLVTGYQCAIGLFDFHTGAALNHVPDQIDYPKGIAWLDATVDARLYPWDFVTWGRSGSLHHYRLHDGRIIALGPLPSPPQDTLAEGRGALAVH